jgi:hypothetical protein
MARPRATAGCFAAGLLVAALTVTAVAQVADDGWLSWSASSADSIGKQAYVKGRVGGWFDTRLLKTERSYNYKLAATWMTPDVVRAAARLVQLARHLDNEATRRLVADAEAAGHTVVMVEIDPREGSGVIPDDWTATLQFDGGEPILGTNVPALRQMPALAGVLRRNYDYDRFWVAFPLVGSDGAPLVAEAAARATLVVRIHDKEGRVEWPVPSSIRQRARTLAGTIG